MICYMYVFTCNLHGVISISLREREGERETNIFLKRFNRICRCENFISKKISQINLNLSNNMTKHLSHNTVNQTAIGIGCTKLTKLTENPLRRNPLHSCNARMRKCAKLKYRPDQSNQRVEAHLHR